VGTREGEGCVVVIEGGVRPHVRVVAEFAGGWEARGLMWGIVGAGVIFLVARVAQRAVQ
jgi:hypothetical protein